MQKELEDFDDCVLQPSPTPCMTNRSAIVPNQNRPHLDRANVLNPSEEESKKLILDNVQFKFGPQVQHHKAFEQLKLRTLREDPATNAPPHRQI